MNTKEIIVSVAALTTLAVGIGVVTSKDETTTVYKIVPIEMVTERVLVAAHETSTKTCRYSSTGLVLLKFTSDKVPEELERVPSMTQPEARAALIAPEWNDGARFETLDTANQARLGALPDKAMR